MNIIEELKFLDIQERQRILKRKLKLYGDEVKIREVIVPLRDYAAGYFTAAVMKKIPKPCNSLEWNLTATTGANGTEALINSVRDAGLSASLFSAANLLWCCTKAIEDNAVPYPVQDWIADAFSGLDSDAVEGRRKSNKVLKGVRQKGTDSNKEKANKRHRDFEKAVNDYIDNYPDALTLGVDGLMLYVKSKNLNLGYKDSSIIQFAKPLFAAKRKAVRAGKI